MKDNHRGSEILVSHLLFIASFNKSNIEMIILTQEEK
jgi:hypothetical protein